MTIKSRFITSYLSMNMVIAGVISVITYFIIQNHFLKLEDIYALRNADRVTQAISEKISAIASTTKDYAYWDDTYQYLETKDPEYALNNLTQTNLGSNLHLDFVIFTNLANEVVQLWQDEAEAPFTSTEFVKPVLTRATTFTDGYDGLTMTPNGVAYISVKPVLPTAKNSSANGMLMMGVMLDHSELVNLAELTRVDIAYLPINSPDINSIKSDLVNNAAKVLTKEGEYVYGYVNLKDVSGDILGVIRLKIQRDIYQEAGRTFSFFVLMIIGVYLFSSFFVVIFSDQLFKNIIVRIRQLQRDIDIEINSNFNHRLKTLPSNHVRDELDQLIITIEKMRSFAHKANSNLAASVEEKTKLLAEKLKKEEKTTSAMTILLDRARQTNYELQEKETQLKKANQKLVKLDHLKDEFLSNVNHELRTPLTSIRMYNQLLYDGDLGEISGPQKQAIEEILQACDHLLDIIQEMLDLKRLEEGKTKFFFQPTDIHQLINEVKVNLKGLTSSSKTEVVFQIPEKFPLINIDQTKIIEVIQNIVGNSIKYNRDHNPIVVTFSEIENEHKNYCQIKIVDQGIGIKPKDLEHMFDKFYRAEAALTQETEGAGLGLNISKQIVLGHHGDISIDSTFGQGTTVTILLPLEK